MNLLIYHPSRQHIYKLLEGIENFNIPYRFYTGMYFTCSYIKPLDFILKRYLIKTRFSNKLNPQNVHCLNWHEEFLFSAWAKLGLFYRKRNRLLFKKHLRFQKKLLNLINTDITHIITFHTNAFFLYEWLKKNSGLNTKLILEAAQPHPKWIKELYKKYELYIKEMPLNYTEEMINMYSAEFEYADTIVAPSTFVKNTLIKYGVDKNKIIINFHGFNPFKKIARKNAFKDEKLHIAFTGLISPSKGFHILKEVAKYTSKIAVFHVFGRPVNKRILKNLPANIQLHGFVSHKTLAEYYSLMHVFYFPTLYDASGLALMEAMYSGLVPIASKNSIAPDIIEPYKNGFLIEPEDAESAIKYIELLHRERKLLQSMSNTVQKDIEKFSWLKYQQKYVEIIKGVH